MAIIHSCTSGIGGGGDFTEPGFLACRKYKYPSTQEIQSLIALAGGGVGTPHFSHLSIFSPLHGLVDLLKFNDDDPGIRLPTLGAGGVEGGPEVGE